MKKRAGRKFAISWQVRVALRKNSTKVLDPGLLSALRSGGPWARDSAGPWPPLQDQASRGPPLGGAGARGQCEVLG